MGKIAKITFIDGEFKELAVPEGLKTYLEDLDVFIRNLQEYDSTLIRPLDVDLVRSFLKLQLDYVSSIKSIFYALSIDDSDDIIKNIEKQINQRLGRQFRRLIPFHSKWMKLVREQINNDDDALAIATLLLITAYITPTTLSTIRTSNVDAYALLRRAEIILNALSWPMPFYVDPVVRPRRDIDQKTPTTSNPLKNDDARDADKSENFEKALKERFEALDARINAANSEFVKFQENLNQLAEQHTIRINGEVQSAEAKLKEVSESFHSVESGASSLRGKVDDVEKSVARVAQEAQGYFEKTKQDLAAFKSTLIQDFELREAATYWRDISRSALFKTIASLAGFVVAIFLGGIATIYTAANTIEFIVAIKVEQQGFAIGTILVLLSLPLVWVLRLFSKLLLDNYSVHSDAEARITMLQTYLALVSEKAQSKITDAGRTIILSAIFRGGPGASDDGTPVALAELIGRLVEKLK